MSSSLDGDGSWPERPSARRRTPWIAAAALALSLAALAPLTLKDAAGPALTPPSTTQSSTDGSSAGDLGGAAAPAPDLPVDANTPDPGTAAADALDRALTNVLRAREQAALDGDATGFLRTVSSRSVSDLEQQRILAGNLAELPLSQWRYALGGAPDSNAERVERLLRRVGAGAVVRAVDLTYQLKGFDVRPVEAEYIVVFVEGPEGWKVAAEIDTGAFLAPWNVAPLNVVQGTSTLVLNASTRFSSSQLVASGDAAVAAVTKIWGGGWDRKVVVVVPVDQNQLGRFLRRDAANYDQLAAVATSELSGDSFIGAANRVWVNPGTWGRVNPLGRSIVLRHEFTHVATGAAVPGDFPIWLEEGLADYIGYRGSGVAPSIVARDLLDDVRAGRLPAALPDRSDFAAGSPTLDTAYESAWWACRYLAQTYGERALLNVYREALDEPDQARAADRALRSVVGISEAELTRRWQASLSAAA